ncbi:SAM-dependent methyltransferase [Saccharothrix ecbatanensis]|uniref:SAM-dependent methyltransferase n=1 Tax=Saccharothrix ecbatanensis TaxID=1105145 RepID=A0A7W9HRH4_9PSEU|nr:glycosyltransferase [Saccharothrix ecbatanensis]MBB5806866.1 SAM-dependent methyltransferase [Saccharothrix ecbatanensis]
MDGGPEYADGAEDEVLTRLRAAQDVSAGSAELAAGLTDWELTYHFSPQRTALLAPLNVHDGLRVLDIGCGSGVLTRALGETGARVVGVEGTPSRAAAAAERCRDLPDVRIVAGDASGLSRHGTFDLALLCGVLEYSPVYGDGPAAMLADVTDALADDGVVVIAIENQLGIGYLLGQPEDHHAAAWMGLADYPAPGAKTWSKARLHAMLADAGLTAQRWLLPYPDYKLPRVILDERVHDLADASDVVDKLVRDPLLGVFRGSSAAVAVRSPHRQAVANGFGASVAPSFLVIAGRTPEAVAKAARPDLGWLVNAQRLPEWRRSRRLTEDLRLAESHRTGSAAGWLRQEPTADEPLLSGAPLDRLLLDALAEHDLDTTRDLLDQWRACCTVDARPFADDETHPFLPGRPDVPVLPPDCLDVHPGNVIVLPDGTPRRIDLEWRAGVGVDAELVLVRALVEFTREVLRCGAAHPWPAETSIRQLVVHLATLIGLDDAARSRWSELIDAEAALQELVSGTRATDVRAALDTDVEAPGRMRLWERGGLDEVRALVADRERLAVELAEAQQVAAQAHREVAETRHVLADAHREVDEAREEVGAPTESLMDAVRALREEHAEAERRLRAEVARVDEEFGRALMELASAETERAEVDRELAAQRTAAEELAAENARLRAQLDRLTSSALVRAGEDFLWPAARLARGTRDLLLGRGGQEPDGVLRRVGKRVPAVTPLLASRVRPVSRRDDRLMYAVDVPATVNVGRGQVIDLEGWAAHADVPVRQVAVVADGRRCPATTGHPRPDVAAAIGGEPNSGFRVRVPVREGLVPLELVVTLVDGTTLRRELPAVRGRSSDTDTAPVEVSWPADGPRVAICLASYRAPRLHFAEQVESIRAQTHPNWVCVISDDGSGDEGVAVLRDVVGDDPRFVIVEHDENVGFYRNFERALSLVPADADLVALSDQDDLWDADKLAVLVSRFTDPAVQLAYCDMRLVDGIGEVVAESVWANRVNQFTDLEQLLLLNTVTGAASMVRADLVRERVLPLPPGTLSAYHDQWIAATALSVGTISFVDRPLHSYRQHGANVTGWQVPRLADGLPGLRGLAAAGVGVGVGRIAARQAELDHITEHELRRIAQFAAVLLMRNDDRLAVEDQARLSRLAEAEHRLWPLVRLALEGEERPQTAGAERRLLAAALLRRAQR